MLPTINPPPAEFITQRSQYTGILRLRLRKLWLKNLRKHTLFEIDISLK